MYIYKLDACTINIFLPFHTVHGVLKTRILKWFPIPFSSGPRVVRGEGDDRGWDGWMASLTQWTWVWVNSGSWWWTGKHGLLQSRVSQRVGHDWATELNWTYSPSVRMTWETDFGLLIHPTWICAASATCRLFAGVGDKDEPSIAFAFRELLVYGRGDRYADRQL